MEVSAGPIRACELRYSRRQVTQGRRRAISPDETSGRPHASENPGSERAEQQPLRTREPTIYGRPTLADIEAACRRRCAALDLEVEEFRQSNHEGELRRVDQQARGTYKALIVNAEAYTHSSIAILDALAAAELACDRVHLSNIFRREAFRHHSYVSTIAHGMICSWWLRL